MGECSENVITYPESVDPCVDEGCWNLRLIMHVHHSPRAIVDSQTINNNWLEKQSTGGSTGRVEGLNEWSKWPWSTQPLQSTKL